MGVEFTYLRPFYPQRAEYIRRSPYGNAYVVAPWQPDAKAWEEDIEALLVQNRERHGISYKVRYVSERIHPRPDPTVPLEEAHEVYEELVGKGDGLSGRRRTTFERDLRNSNGRVSPGPLLLVEVDGVLRWYEGPWQGWMNRVIQLLNAVLQLGPDYMRDLTRLPETWAIPPKELVDAIARMADSEEEGRLLRELLLSGALGAGEPTAQFPVGVRLRWGRHGFAELPRSGKKFVDLVHEAGPETAWVVEAKETLDWCAVGQALGYATLYEDDRLAPDGFPGPVTVRPAVVCRHVDETIAYCARARGVAVFSGGERLA